MKRYRVLPLDFDTRANILIQKIGENWEPDVKKQWENNKRLIKERLIAEFGALNAYQKIQNFTDLGPYPLSIIAFHNKFLHQARYAFVISSYYPALTAACSLGERILNHLILALREDHRKTPEYKKVYRKDSFDNWDLAIDTLESWGVLLKKPASLFRELRDIRIESIHFRPEVDTNDRGLALSAINKLIEIISKQFSGFGPQPWFITKVPGECYIKKSWELNPFIKKIYLPSCVYVGPKHKIVSLSPQIKIDDDFEYEDKEISDNKFVTLRNSQ